MIDDIKIKEAAMQHSRWLSSNHEKSTASDSFMEGAKWMQEEFLKDLWHPASEMPDKNRTCLVRVVYHPNHGMFQDEERIEQSSFHDFAHCIPFQQITKSGFSSSDFDIFEETKYDFIINCPRICKEYKIVVSKVQIKKITIKEPKELFDILSYIENFNEEAKTRINKIIHTYLNIS